MLSCFTLEGTTMLTAHKESEYLTQTELLQRSGWTKTILKKLDFQPDFVKNHYLYGKTCKVKLFSLKRIDEKEKTCEFIENKYDVQKKKDRARRGVQTKIKNILQKIISLTINVKRVEKVTTLALNSYNAWNAQRMISYVTLDEASQAFLARISVNYIRHNLTKYEYNIEKVSGKTGKALAYDLELYIVLSEIARVYPEFAEECRRQYWQKSLSLELLTLS